MDFRDFHFYDLEHIQAPEGICRALRESEQLPASDRHGGFHVLATYEEVRAAAGDPETFRSRHGDTIPQYVTPMPMVPLASDPPDHARQRKVLMPAFSPQRMRALEPVTAKVADRLIDAFAVEGRADLIAEYVEPLVGEVFSEAFGLPDDIAGVITEFMVGAREARLGGDPARAAAANLTFIGYVEGLLHDEHGDHDEDSMIELLRRESRPGGLISRDEAIGMAFSVLAAGIDTTTGGLGAFLAHLATNPADRDRLAAEPELIPVAAEESLRVFPPAAAHGRKLSCPVNVRGTDLEEGSWVALHWAAANRDPAVFDRPDEVVIDRRPNRHMAFGYGVHRCIGAPLSQMEMRVATERLLTRLPDFTLAPGATITRGRTPMPQHLQVVFTTT